jgi:hypothetical protein
MQNEAGAFSLNRPEAQAKDEYLYLWQTYEINLAHLICSSDAKFDPRIPRMVRFMISLIAHDNIRRFAETRFDEAIRYANSRKDLPLDERNEMILRICATMCGNLTAYVDQFKGLAHQLKIGELVDMSKDYYQESIHPEAIEIGKEETDTGVELNYGMICKTNVSTSLTPEDVVTDEEPPPAFTTAETNGEGTQTDDWGE